MILVHGWTCDESTWNSQVPALSKDYRVITLDLPGHGRSGSPKDGKLSMDLFARAVDAVRKDHHAGAEAGDELSGWIEFEDGRQRRHATGRVVETGIGPAALRHPDAATILVDFNCGR